MGAISIVVVERDLSGCVGVGDIVPQRRLSGHDRVSSECTRLSIVVVSGPLPGRPGEVCARRATYVIVASRRLVLRRGTNVTVAVLRDVPLVGELVQVLHVSVVLLRHISEWCAASATAQHKHKVAYKEGSGPKEAASSWARQHTP